MKMFFFLLFSCALIQVYSQVPFNKNPNWTSTDVSNVATGGAFVDLNKDGWLDFVAANGNDISIQSVVVYYNDGTGKFPAAPDWQSDDTDYHGHLAVGDVNGDGWLDVAVSVYIGKGGFSTPGKVKLFLNNNGALSSNPDWVSTDLFYTFSCAFGDADGDGDLDLAVAAGESYYGNPEHLRIYYNENGILESLPSWKSLNQFYSYDVGWADFDNDGDLDLVCAGEENPNYIFENYGDSISVTPTWQSTDASQYANSLFVGDVNNDGFPDLAISDNNQLGGTGKFKIYLNDNGTLQTTPFWMSSFSGMGSGINLADIDNDDDLDLITGGWWDNMRIYLNNNGNFNSTPDYTSISGSVVEAIICGDIDNDALISKVMYAEGPQKLFYLPKNHIQKINNVFVDGDTLQFNEYCYNLENGWISLAVQPDSGAEVVIVYIYSNDIDIGITNWDQILGNYIYLNNTNPVYVENESGHPENFILHQNYPNPFNPSTKIKYSIPSVTLRQAQNENWVSLRVYDILGNEVATLVNAYKPAGNYEVDFNGHSDKGQTLSGGVYFYTLRAGSFVETKKMILLR
ncbi:MAG: FG-GAP-like repeat-containing protein [Ignavibacteriaceae bacterium]|jgi:hypothetical protein|nr:FG-GAP-like repeat-containing protein [Ignavibacteriaceae bacterium]